MNLPFVSTFLPNSLISSVTQKTFQAFQTTSISFGYFQHVIKPLVKFVSVFHVLCIYVSWNCIIYKNSLFNTSQEHLLHQAHLPLLPFLLEPYPLNPQITFKKNLQCSLSGETDGYPNLFFQEVLHQHLQSGGLLSLDKSLVYMPLASQWFIKE
jgi:hypothetical protein